MAQALSINDSGEIAGDAVLPNGDTHAFLLIPDGDSDENTENRISESQRNAELMRQSAPALTERAEPPPSPIERIRNQMRQRYHLPGQRPAMRD